MQKKLTITIDESVYQGLYNNIGEGKISKFIAKGRGTKKEKPVYNRLTTACIGLGLISDKELSTIDDKRLDEIEKDLEQIKDISTTFKIVRNEKTGFLNIDPKTIQIIKE